MSGISCFCLRAGFNAVVLFRLAAALERRGRVGHVMASVLRRISISHNGCDIDPRATIGPGLKLPHPVGIVIGPATIGAGAMILQNVTIGMSRFDDDEHSISSFPVIGDHVTISSGAAILGPIKIGDSAKIGANAVVLRDVGEGLAMGGVPARPLKVQAAASD